MTERSLTGKRWTLREHGVSGDVVGALRSARNLDAVIDPADCVPPDAMKALEQMKRAIAEKECIAIFGDYDCDGITSSLQLLRFLRRHGGNPRVRLPHRQRDGYGLQLPTVEALAAEGVQLLITVDNGGVATEAVAEARKRGMDVIIIDHHRLAPVRPDANVILHPDDVPALADAAPCAAGLVYLLQRAWEGGDWEGSDQDLALAAIGTVADLVPLRGINRAIVIDGLRALGRLPDCPLKELARGVAEDRALTCQDIAFRIAPRLNAAGRMDDPAVALEALLFGGEALAKLEGLNRQRQEITETLFRQSLDALRAGGHENDPFLCIAGAFPAGIVGLLAGKLTEMFGRPSLVASIVSDVCTASLRSPAAYDVAGALTRMAPLLRTFGGHAQAGGCTFDAANLPLLRTNLCADVLARTTAEQLEPTLWIDAVVQAGNINASLLRSLEGLAPHGQGNPEPLFLVENVRMDKLRTCGRDNAHLQGSIGPLRSIGWRLGNLLPLLPQAQVDLACRVTRDDWRGGEAIQLEIADVRLAVRKEAPKLAVA